MPFQTSNSHSTNEYELMNSKRIATLMGIPKYKNNDEKKNIIHKTDSEIRLFFRFKTKKRKKWFVQILST